MKTTLGWVLVGLGVVAIGYLGWVVFSVANHYYPWYEFVPALIKYPWQPYFWTHFGSSLIAGVLLLVFGIRGLTKKARARA